MSAPELPGGGAGNAAAAKRRSPAHEVALCGMMTALAVVILCIDSFIPIGLYFCPILASMTLIPAQEECRPAYARACFGASALLGLLLCTDKECAALFCFLGYYPLLRPRLQTGLRKKGVRIAVKALFFTVSMAVMYGLLLFVFGLDELVQEFQATALWTLVLLAAAGGALFAMYDVLLEKYTALYRIRRRKKTARNG